MTVAQVRKENPSAELLFFKDGMEMQKAPFLHDQIKEFEVKKYESGRTVAYIDM